MNHELEKKFDKLFGIANDESARFILRQGRKEIFIDNTAIKSFIDKHYIAKEDCVVGRGGDYKVDLYTKAEMLEMVGKDKDKPVYGNGSPNLKAEINELVIRTGYNQRGAEIRSKIEKWMDLRTQQRHKKSSN